MRSVVILVLSNADFALLCAAYLKSFDPLLPRASGRVKLKSISFSSILSSVFIN
jgi:hypothetical protein